jgi:hypothetical protein
MSYLAETALTDATDDKLLLQQKTPEGAQITNWCGKWIIGGARFT